MNHTELQSMPNVHFVEFSTLTARQGTTTERGMRDLAQRMVKIRKEKGITQVELAERLGVTQPMISRIEKGELRLNGEVIVKLAKMFGVSTDELLGLRNSNNHADQAVGRRWLKRLNKITQLPKRDQDALIRTIDRFLKAAENE